MMRLSLKLLLFLCLALPISLFAEIKGTYGIVNAETGLSIRPFEARNATGNKIIMYRTIPWKCMTWHFEQVKDNTYLLKNLFTGKTLHPSETPPKEGNSLVQIPCDKEDKTQLWDFISANEGKYKIRLSGTELYLTAANTKENNSSLTLDKDIKSGLQEWTLVEQSPSM